ncbi:MAG: hypothetical protein N2482_00480 [Patescibacteria group bacterium]|nr:hypothetical protein [Patescibacteria group bacterium]
MPKIFLSLRQVQRLVIENRYQVEKKNTTTIFFPGGDLGELALIFSTANNYGFSVNQKKVYQVLTKVLGSKEIFFPEDGSFIFDFFQRSKSYGLVKRDIDFLKTKTEKIVSEKKLNQFQSALLIVYGEKWSVYSQSLIEVDNERKEKIPVSVFVFHQSLVDKQHRKLCQYLIKEKAVRLYPGCDEEYLYQVLSTESENFLFEGLKENYQGLPIFKVKFNEKGEFEVEEMGKI